MKQTFYFTLLGAILACCTPMDKMETICYEVFRYETAGLSAISDFNPRIGEFEDFLFFMDQKQVFSVAAIKYQTVDPNGKQVWASGLVYHPVNRKSRGVIDFMPTAHLDKDGGGTDEFYAVEGLLILLGYTVIVPDLIGSGISKELPMPFLMSENTGRVSYDMRRAAAQYLWDYFRYQLPSETTIMGYSLGGSAALATQKYYEAHHANTVKVKEVYAGGGAYDLLAAFSAFAQTGYCVYPAIPKTILAFKHYYFDCFDRTLDLNQIFTGELLLNYDDWFSGDYHFSAIMGMLGTDLHAYMHPDFFKPWDQHNDELKKLQPYLKENSVTEGWRPKAPIYLMHATEDDHAPIECAEIAVKNLRKAGAHVSYITYPGDHLSVADFYFMRSILRFFL